MIKAKQATTLLAVDLDDLVMNNLAVFITVFLDLLDIASRMVQNSRNRYFNHIQQAKSINDVNE